MPARETTVRRRLYAKQRCRQTGKRRYADELDVLIDNDRNARAIRAYHCPHCKSWHGTSQAQRAVDRTEAEPFALQTPSQHEPRQTSAFMAGFVRHLRRATRRSIRNRKAMRGRRHGRPKGR